MKKTFTINDLPQSERPRERMQKYGAEALSVQELLALVLGRGTRGESVVVAAQRLLAKFGDIKGISEASVEELSSVKGLGLAKSTQIKAVFELAKRSQLVEDKRVVIKSYKDVVELVAPGLKDKKKEYFVIICLNVKNEVIKVNNVSIGSLDTAIAHPREVFKEAISSLAYSIILVHNHPSGNAEPSPADKEITRKILKTGDIVGIEVVDHIIIAGGNSFSFRDKGLI